MAAAVLLGCAAIALGPAAALVLLTVAAEPLLLIVLVAGAFFWLLSLLAASLLWSVWVQLSGREDAALPLGAAAAVLLQELCRFACFKMLKKADAGLATLSKDGRSPLSLRRVAYAFLTMALVLLHTFWGIIFFDACERRRAGGLGLVVGSHLLTSGLTFLNPWYEASLGPILILTLCTGLWAFSTAGGSFHNVLKCLSCKQEPEGQAMLYSALQVPPEG
ncbi:gamma-secretase subunit APH-1A isoform 2-T2 [Geothlypis trichas]